MTARVVGLRHPYAWVCFVILAATMGAVTLVLILRLCIVLRSHDVKPRESLSLLIVAGSGGHTTEILRLVGSLSSAYSPRHYIIADTDTMSANKINSFEHDRVDRDSSALSSSYHIHRIPRSREVHQSWLSTACSTLRSLWLSFPLVHGIKPDLKNASTYLWDDLKVNEWSRVWWRTPLIPALGRQSWIEFPSGQDALHVLVSGRFPSSVPDSREQRRQQVEASMALDLQEKERQRMVLCNGPGTCVPVCVSALLLGVLGIKKVIIVYAESICRVETLSLSGKILFYLSDYFIVQWPTLKEKYPKSVYLGRIV
uniref:UDP-N-acetylglucosamine transferase subunit ALG14 homolog isoform X1 n=1 Tax=Jaculus jaculus TaxID=51337 RepID=UPI001E1B028E|nr:UDP-N-acetylglucosamine transferase subunit ALG14 homolog isoform X1 [Jaculus jaculus]